MLVYNDLSIILMTSSKMGVIEISLRGSHKISDKTLYGMPIFIDWGDDTPEEKMLLYDTEVKYSHNYKNDELHYIIIFSDYEITELICCNAELTSLDVNYCAWLKEVNCSDNLINSIDVSKNIELINLTCNNNQLTNIVLGENFELRSLYCNNNQLRELSTSGCRALEVLECNDNPLTSLDVSACGRLHHIMCNNTQLTNMNLSGCSSLSLMTVNDNQLTAIDASDCNELKSINCQNNQLSETAMNSFFETLHHQKMINKTLAIQGNPGSDQCDKTIATNKFWHFY